MQWRHDNVHGEKFPPSEGKPVTANGICRVQVTNGTVDRLATVGCSSEMGDPLTALHVLRFGHWLVAMNSNLYLAEQWAVPASYAGRTFSGQQIYHPDPSFFTPDSESDIHHCWLEYMQGRRGRWSPARM
jgi:hypothetical protein